MLLLHPDLWRDCWQVTSVEFDSVRPHRWQPTRLPRPWDSPDKNTRVGCHFLLQWMKVKSESEVTQSCLTLRDPMDCSPPGSSVHAISQARVLEWVVIAFSVGALRWLIMPLTFPFWVHATSFNTATDGAFMCQSHFNSRVCRINVNSGNEYYFVLTH